MFMEKRCGRLGDHPAHDWQAEAQREEWLGGWRTVRPWFRCPGRVLTEGAAR